MKTIQKRPMMEPRTAAVLIGLTLILGLIVHQFFFVGALGVMLFVTLEWTAQKLQEYLRQFRSFHWYP